MLFVGKLSKRRHVPDLIEAFSIVREKQNIPHHLILVGPNVNNLSLQALAEKHGVGSIVKFYPYLEQPRLAKLYAGAELFVTDVFEAHCQRAVNELDATLVAPDDIYGLDVDVFAPCALGAVINDETLPQLKASVVAGASNNQLARPEHGEKLHQREILYAPDYVINAGGIIDIAYQRSDEGDLALLKHIEGIGETLEEIFARSQNQERSTHLIADKLAEELFE